MFKSLSLVNVIRDGELKTKQIYTKTKGPQSAVLRLPTLAPLYSHICEIKTNSLMYKKDLYTIEGFLCIK